MSTVLSFLTYNILEKRCTRNMAF